jgi:hypothetical protein
MDRRREREPGRAGARVIAPARGSAAVDPAIAMLLGLQASAGNRAVGRLVNRSITVQRFWPFDDEEGSDGDEETVPAEDNGSIPNEEWGGGEAASGDEGGEAAPGAEGGESAPDGWVGPGGDWGAPDETAPGESQPDGGGGQDWIGPGGEWGAGGEEAGGGEGAGDEGATDEGDFLGGKEPCFDPGAQGEIELGVAWADAAAAHLSAKPPSLETALAELNAALETWEGAFGSDPGQSEMNEAKDAARRAGIRVSAYAEPVSAMLEHLSTAAVAASGDASAASTMMTEPASAEEEPRPCFEEGQRAVIAEAVNLADGAATELSRRPPDYYKALAALRNASSRLESLGGEAPGQARLRGAVATLNGVVDGVGAYLAPVDSVVTDAAADMEAASSQARAAAKMTVPDEEGG